MHCFAFTDFAAFSFVRFLRSLFLASQQKQHFAPKSHSLFLFEWEVTNGTFFPDRLQARFSCFFLAKCIEFAQHETF